jgi:hypothetical protein
MKYKQKLAEFDIKSLDDDNLDPAFVAKAKEFETKLEKGSLSDDEIASMDDELSKDFDELHEFEEVESDDVIQLRRQNTILSGKQKIESVSTIDELKAIAKEYEDFPEVVEIATNKAAKIKAEYDKKTVAQKALEDLKASIQNATSVSDLKVIAEENADNKEIVDLAKAKAAELNQKQEQEKTQTLKQKLLSQKHWTYPQLIALGVKPTGNDMVVEGVKLNRVYLFKAYETERQ